MGDHLLREMTAARIAVAGAVVTIVSAIAYMIAYAFDANVYALGTCAALGFGGIATSFCAWALGVLRPARVVEERDVAPAFSDDELELGRTFERGEAGLSRVRLFRTLSALAAGAVGLAALFPLRSLSFRGASAPPVRRSWKAGVRVVTETGRIVRRGDLDVGAIATVFPEGGMDDPTSSVVLIRLDPNDPKTPYDGRDLSPDGYAAFSKICTHVGCPVALYRKSAHELLCPCHQSRFDVLHGARPVGGPASRALPQLALVFDADGTLRARAGFTEAIGPAAWGES